VWLPKHGTTLHEEAMIRLHDYWRSTAAYRVRIALNLKGLDYRQTTHDLLAGEQRAEDYLKLNPQGLVPAIEVKDDVLVQSPAILEWLEERYPDPPLLPEDLSQRAIVRGMAAMIGCDIHPLNNLRVLTALRQDFDASNPQVKAWIWRWINAGFEALETVIAAHGKGFAFGDQPTLADCFVVPQVYSARRYGVDLTPYPAIVTVDANASALPEFAAAHPDRQPRAKS
jgi:maleylpyruvate isomerase